MAYPHVRVSGTPRERGRQYGSQAASRIAASIEAYRGVFEHYAGWDWGRVRAESDAYRPAIGAFHRDSLEEIAGIAEGAGVDELDVLAINTRTEVMYAAVARTARGATPPHECSSFGALPSATRAGHVVIGQNWDWLPHVLDTVVVLEVERDDAPSYVTVVEAGLLAKCGLNGAGVGILANALVTFDDIGTPAVPFHVMLRALFDADSLPAAFTTLQLPERSSSANYLLGHATGGVIDIEGAPGDFTRLYRVFPDRDGLVVHTNHFVAPSFPGPDVSPKSMPDSPFRLDRLERLLRAALPLEIEDVQAALADHAEYPNAVCCHPTTSLHETEQGVSAASVIMDLDERVLWLADGNPCLAPYRRLDYAALLGDSVAVGD